MSGYQCHAIMFTSRNQNGIVKPEKSCSSSCANALRGRGERSHFNVTFKKKKKSACLGSRLDSQKAGDGYISQNRARVGHKISQLVQEGSYSSFQLDLDYTIRTTGDPNLKKRKRKKEKRHNRDNPKSPPKKQIFKNLNVSVRYDWLNTEIYVTLLH